MEPETLADAACQLLASGYPTLRIDMAAELVMALASSPDTAASDN
jgi:hypothetical protein